MPAEPAPVNDDDTGTATRTLWLPEGLDVRDLPAWTWRHEGPILALVSRILTSAVASDRAGFTPIRCREGRATFGSHNWTPVRNGLIQLGVLECDGRFRVGEKAYHYRLGARWRSRPVRHRPTSDPATLLAWRAIRGRGEGAGEGADAVCPSAPDRDTIGPVQTHLNRWLRIVTLDGPTIERGMAAVEGDERRIYAQMIADLARHGDPDDRDGERCVYGRFHSLVTRMPRWMRAALRIDGESLTEVDIRSTQPLLQVMSAIKHHAARNTPGAAHPATRPPTPTDHHTIGAQFYAHAWKREVLPPDLAEGLEAAESGSFYEWFAERVGLPPGDREAAKKAWAWLVYDRPRREVPEWRERWERYRRACPSVAAWLELTKRRDYREAAREMQRYESRLMIRDVCGWLATHHPDLPILTIHDAILTPAAGLEPVCEAIRWAWGREGASPALKIVRPA